MKTQETKYSKSYIQRMFAELEPVMVYDENKYLSLNQTAVEWYGFSPYDVEFAQEYIAVNNNLIDAMATGGNVAEALLPITEGKFSGIFDESKRVKRGFWDSSACGGGYDFPHPQPDAKRISKSFSSITEAEDYLLKKGYHSVPIPYSYNPTVDYSKTKPYLECGDGPMRQQAIIRGFHPIGSYVLNIDTYWPEPNPEVGTYLWPSYWRASYTHWWHTTFT